MNSYSVPENSLLLMQFRQFAGELIQQKQSLEARFPLAAGLVGENALEGAADAPGSDAMLAMIAETQRARGALLSLLHGQATRVQQLGGSLGYSIYREAQYVMAVTADELMLNAVWVGKKHWRLLEDELFQTHAAGDIFFQRLESLLAPPVLASSELAMVYFQALALDFRGRFRGFDPQQQLARYRRQLFDRIFGHPYEKEAGNRLFPLSYSQDAEEEMRRLTSAHVWWLVLGGICVLWILASALLWQRISVPIDAKVRSVQQHFQSSAEPQTEGTQ